MRVCLLSLAFAFATVSVCAQHDHAAPEKLGKVSFPTSCSPKVRTQFERGIALLHSFAYGEAEKAFREIESQDPQCAMARWGMAMSFYHQLWQPWITPANLERGRKELEAGEKLRATPRERQYLAALSEYYRDPEKLNPPERAAKYKDAMSRVAKDNAADPEAQIFYALALLGTASPADKTHANAKEAAAILEPMYKRFPQHPGVAHYLIHSYDSTELAPRGLQAARDYSKIAPSAPHALHMPSHIFTRLGYWDDSIESNLAARKAAHDQGDIGEELHAMDYLTYAYLQKGRNDDAGRVLKDLHDMNLPQAGEFKIGYAATAMPVRYAIERQDWVEASKIEPIAGAEPHVAAIAYWAKAVGLARGGHPDSAVAEIIRLENCLVSLRTKGNTYWAAQTDVLLKEAQAWNAYALGNPDKGSELLRSAADEEDSLEKLPVTPGPIVPAREQLGEMLLGMKWTKDSLQAYESALASAPGRRGALTGAVAASEQLGETTKAEKYRTALR